ncbi:hypothetical protein FGB62_325g020 [Gracilaria domingensis]|nr:hypothetical protein FGB62_325g020 [Gracilaria domingensis]
MCFRTPTTLTAAARTTIMTVERAVREGRIGDSGAPVVGATAAGGHDEDAGLDADGATVRHAQAFARVRGTSFRVEAVFARADDGEAVGVANRVQRLGKKAVEVDVSAPFRSKSVELAAKSLGLFLAVCEAYERELRLFNGKRVSICGWAGPVGGAYRVLRGAAGTAAPERGLAEAGSGQLHILVNGEQELGAGRDAEGDAVIAAHMLKRAAGALRTGAHLERLLQHRVGAGAVLRAGLGEQRRGRRRWRRGRVYQSAGGGCVPKRVPSW